MDRIAPRFARFQTLRNAGALMLGLVSDLGPKNCWTLAERSGHPSPDWLQHLLSRAKWDADGVGEDLPSYVSAHLGDGDAVLVVDGTGDVKKGAATVGVQRQYTGTAGRIENSQVAVYLAYPSAASHALIDREPALAAAMLTRAVHAGTPARWAAGDEVYGADPGLRTTVCDLGLGYGSASAPTALALIALTINEFRRLFDALLLRPLHTIADI
jgi:SRSO17 transposase